MIVLLCVFYLYLSNYIHFLYEHVVHSFKVPAVKKRGVCVVMAIHTKNDEIIDNKAAPFQNTQYRVRKIFFTVMMMNLKRVETCSPTEPKSNYVSRLDTNGSVVVVEKFPVTFRGYTYGTFSFRLVVTRRLFIDSITNSIDSITNRGSSCIPKRNEGSSASSGVSELCW